MIFLETYLAKSIYDTIRWRYYQRNHSKVKEILMISGTLFHLFDWRLLHFAKKLQMGRESKNKSNIEITEGKLPGPSLMILGTKPLYRARNL